jgi:hypothetical protein
MTLLELVDEEIARLDKFADGTPVKKEKYCLGCETEMYENLKPSAVSAFWDDLADGRIR